MSGRGGRAPGRGVVVVGGGWSGIAAALTLADAGRAVTLLEAAPQLGGRARRVDLALGDRRFPLDNGQHLLIGAYRQTLALARRLGVDPAQAFRRQRFTLAYPDGFRLRAPPAPAPLHLAGALILARGLRWRDRVAMARTVHRWRRTGWRAAAEEPAIGLMQGMPAVAVERIWQPLCVAALNVRLEQASARVFLTVLRDSLDADRAASDLLLPRTDLSALLPAAAEAALRTGGADLRLRWPVEALGRTAEGWRLSTRAQSVDADAVVLALPPWRAAPLLRTAGLPELAPVCAELSAIRAAPIATVYLRYPAGTRLPIPAMALREAPQRQAFGQWAFDRGALDPRCDGVVGVVISAAGAWQALDGDALAHAVAQQLARDLRLPAALAARRIDEKRATIVPSPGLVRPPAVLPVTGLYLAGDAADSPYPSTLEGSVRSGLAAAHALLAAQ